MKITRKLIESLNARSEEYFAWCDAMPGFGVRVALTGRKTYIIRYRTEARTQRKMTLGRCDLMTPDEARDIARAHLVEVAKGGDPARSRTDRKKSATVDELREKHKKAKANRIKPQTARNYEILWRLHILPRIGKLRVADVTQEDIADLHTDMGETPVNANRALEVLSSAFKVAETIGWRPRGSNPCDEVESYAENERQRILTPEEIKAVFAACDAYDGAQRWFPWLVRLLLVTGLRVSEWAAAKREWVSFERCTLTLPDSKTGGRVVHLPDAALEMLRSLFAAHNSEWVIAGVSADVPLRWPFPYWREMRKGLGLDNVRLHDLRHTVGSLGHMAGLSQREIADLLGHRQLRTTERYLHTYDDRKRTVANIAAQAIVSR